MTRLAILVLSCLAALTGCAMQPASTSMAHSPSACEVATVPADAILGVREGVDTATYPSQIPPGLTGCQRVWFGDHQRPAAMQVLATYYFAKGQVQRLVGQVPGGQAYDCRYSDGALDSAQSRNPGVCPDAAQVDRLPLSRR
jgi:hypothetical protein